MKKMLYILLLLSQYALHGMEEKASQSDKQITAFQSIDPAIKEDISLDDPLSFEKMARYSDMLSIELNRCLKENNTINPEIVEKVSPVLELLAGIKNACTTVEQSVTTEEVADTREILMRMNRANILLWNELKNWLLPLLDSLKK